MDLLQLLNDILSGNPKMPVGSFQDRVMQLPGIFYNGKIPGEDKDTYGALKEPTYNKHLIEVAGNAPKGTITHEAAHGLLYKILRDPKNAKLLGSEFVPGLGQEEFAYGVSSPLGNFTPSPNPVQGISDYLKKKGQSKFYDQLQQLVDFVAKQNTNGPQNPIR